MAIALRDEAIYERGHPRASVVAAIAALDLAPGMQALDVGCGPGAHLGPLAAAVAPGGRVTGVDIAADRLAIAADLCAAEIAAGAVALHVGDLRALPFADGAFDLVWSSLVLHHEEEPVRTLAEFARVARPGGRVAILDGDGGGSFPLLPWPPDLELRLRAAGVRADAERYAGRLGYHFSGYLGRWLPRLLREAGLADVRLHAFADVDRAPLDARRAALLRDWLIHSFGRRLRDYLAPRDWERFAALVTAGSPDDLLTDPDFFLARTWFFAVGTVSLRDSTAAF